MMTYEDCVRANYFGPESWAILCIMLLVSAVLAKRNWRKTAAAVSLFGLCFAVFNIYVSYEMNCVELII